MAHIRGTKALLLATYIYGFGVEGDTEALAHVSHDGVGQAADVAPGGAAVVDQDEGLLVPYACRSYAAALPSALVDEPAR